MVIAEEIGARLVEAQTEAGGRCAQDREQQQGLQGRQHDVSSGTSKHKRRQTRNTTVNVPVPFTIYIHIFLCAKTHQSN